MRLEINIPDNTRPELKARLTSLTQQLSAHPELAMDIRLNDETEDVAIQKLFTPELMAEIEAADADIDAGNYVTSLQLDEHFKQKTAAWMMQQHPH